MKKVLFFILCFSSLHAGIEIHTLVLSKEPADRGYYRWADKALVDLVMNTREREVITYCDSRGWWDHLFNDYYHWEWCKRAVKEVHWKYIKNYYVFTLQAPGYEEEDITVTEDQLFKCIECHSSTKDLSNSDMAWIPAKDLYLRFNEDNNDCTTICCSPHFVDGKSANKKALIVSIIKMKDEHNQPKEFFSLTIDEARTYLVGKAHYWILGD